MEDSKRKFRGRPRHVVFLLLLIVVPLLNQMFVGVTFDLQYDLGFAFDFNYVHNAETGETRLTMLLYHFAPYFTSALGFYMCWEALPVGFFRNIIFICFLWLCKDCIDVLLWNNITPYYLAFDYVALIVAIILTLLNHYYYGRK